MRRAPRLPLLLGHGDQAGVGGGGGAADLLEVVELERRELGRVAVEHVDDALADRDRAGGDQRRLGAVQDLVEGGVDGRRRERAVEHARFCGDGGLDDRGRAERDQQVLDAGVARERADRLPAERELVADGEHDGGVEGRGGVAEQDVEDAVAIRGGGELARGGVGAQRRRGGRAGGARRADRLRRGERGGAGGGLGGGGVV